MAVDFDERLEGTGYEETWSLGEVLGGGATLNEDQATSGVTGAPDNWAVQCGQWVYVAANNCYTGDVDVLVPDSAISYTRFEFIVNAESLADTEQNAITLYVGGGGGVANIVVYIRQESGSLLCRIDDARDDTTNLSSSVTLSLDTPYVIETVWDTTNNEVKVWFDGVVLVDAVLSAGAATRPNDTVVWGGVDVTVAAAMTIYKDNHIANNAAGERVGTGRFLQGLQPLSGGVSTKTLSPSHALGGQLNGALQAA